MQPASTDEAMRSRLGAAPDDFLVVHSGNMGAKQDLLNVVDAASGLSRVRLDRGERTGPRRQSAHSAGLAHPNGHCQVAHRRAATLHWLALPTSHQCVANASRLRLHDQFNWGGCSELIKYSRRKVLGGESTTNAPSKPARATPSRA